LFRNQYPSLPLNVVDQSSYKHLSTVFESLIANWERQGDPLPTKGERLCPTCGLRVLSIHTRTRFCSRACNNVRYRHPKETRKCGVCKTDFLVLTTSLQRFCSKECGHRGKADTIRAQRIGKRHTEATKRKIRDTKLRRKLRQS
jgi:endogenous inhibitor of DNA gyrase (YacG/DUF329 family)